MKEEIQVAVSFLTRLIGKSGALDTCQLEQLENSLSMILVEKFQNHWFPDKPFKGQAYRCIRVNEMEKDPVLDKAAQDCSLKYEELGLPVELTLWVDPEEVCCRFGEHKGSYCTLASFRGGNKENYVDQINIDDLEKRSIERTRLNIEMMGTRRNGRKNDPRSPKGKHHYPGISPYSTLYYGSSPPHYYSYSTSPEGSPYSFANISTSPGFGASYNRFTPKCTRSPSYGGSHSYSPTFPQGPNFNGRADKYHWINKAIVKA